MSTVVAERPTVYQDYSIDRKAEVLALLHANDGNILRTSRETGIDHSTIRYWIQNQARFSEIQARKSVDLDAKLDRNVHKLLDSIEDHDLADTPLNQKAQAFGIVFDKLQLVRGQPTSITANVDRQELTIVLQQALEAIDVTPGAED